MLTYKSLFKKRTGIILLNTAVILVFVYLMYPFVDITKFEGFNSDSAIRLNMISESTPLLENIYAWGDGRCGSILVVISKLSYLIFSPKFILILINILISTFLVLGFSIPIIKGSNMFIFPLSLLFFVTALRFLPTQNSETLLLVTVDLGHRPDLLLFLNAMAFFSVKNFFENKRDYLILTIVSICATWISDMSLFILLSLCLFLSLVDLFKNKKIQLWYWAVFCCTLAVHVLLKGFTPYGSYLYKFATLSQFKSEFVNAIRNLYLICPKFLWIAMLVLNLCFGILYLYLRYKNIKITKIMRFYFRYWVILLIMVFASFSLPFFNDWFYANLMLVRYLAPSLHLLMLCSSVCVCGMLHVTTILKDKRIFFITWSIFSVLLLLFLPAFFSLRSEFINHPLSQKYTSGQVLAQNCDSVLGDYWTSYVYILGGFGRIKTGSLGYDRSRSNLEQVLSESNLCIVESSQNNFREEYRVIDKTLKPRNSEDNPIKLPDGNYFKHYVNI